MPVLTTRAVPIGWSAEVPFTETVNHGQDSDSGFTPLDDSPLGAASSGIDLLSSANEGMRAEYLFACLLTQVPLDDAERVLSVLKTLAMQAF
jgi:hypothetical protein